MVLVVKNPPANAEDLRDTSSIRVGKIPWRRARQSIQVFLPGESPWTEEHGGLLAWRIPMDRGTWWAPCLENPHGQRSLELQRVGYD